MTQESIYNYEYCLRIAQIGHYFQKRKYSASDTPYILHPLSVANNFKEEPKLRCVAILHDVVEDTFFTLSMLHDLHIPDDVLELVDILTRKKEDTYRQYIEKVVQNREASLVKYYDVLDNMPTAPEGMVKDRYEPTLRKIKERWDIG